MGRVCGLEIQMALKLPKEWETVRDDHFVTCLSCPVVHTSFDIDGGCVLQWMWVVKPANLIAITIYALTVF